MPIYDYHCEKCSIVIEEYHNSADRNNPSPCPECGGRLILNAFSRGVATRGNYNKPVELQSMGFIADAADVAEHRKRFPDVELAFREGSAVPVVKSLSQKRAYMKAAGWADVKDYR
jgi:putative FmdB family regulatory protein